MILLNGGGPSPAQTFTNGSQGSLTFAHWLGASYGECLAHGWLKVESKEECLLPARSKVLQQ